MKEYEDRSCDIPAETQNQLCLQLIVPDAIRQRLDLNGKRFNAYVLMREAITDYLSTRIFSVGHGGSNYLGGGKAKDKSKKGSDKKTGYRRRR